MSILCKKIFSRAPVKCLSLYGSDNSDSVAFKNTAFGEIKDHSFKKKPFHKKKLLFKFQVRAYLMKKGILKSTSEMLFSLWLELIRFCSLWEYGFWRHQRLQFDNDTFSVQKSVEVSRLYLSYVKTVFSRAPVKCFYLYSSNCSDSLAFGNAAFGEMKDHSLRTTLFEEKTCKEVLRLCLSYVKRYFEQHQ